MPIHDNLQRFIFENAPIRGEIVHLDATWQAVLERRQYPPRVREVLGELMAAAALLTSTLKFDGRLIMQIQGKGPVSLLVVECTSDRTMRAIAQWQGEIPDAPLAALVGDGRLAVTIDPLKGKERYQAIVALEGLTVAEAFENYFARSEQLATRLWLASDPQQAAGMLLQRLPQADLVDDDAWARAVHLGSTITREELLALPVSEIVHRLYHEEDIRLFSRMPVSFRCSCSRARVEAVLRMLGHDEIHSILDEQGSVNVDCEFCGSRYEFDRIDAEQLFAALHSAPATPTRH
ncbi:Hsp33 family molecular chaperone HslO [Sulfuricaulis sp.]|jgi:molecular chaperone Hsp33|uniref:Hsp33 family molecular chaperone HslO n=1 Tax=Sulfuricaulis sp. TaxID=2003553 RepID=UPI003559C11A